MKNKGFWLAQIAVIVLAASIGALAQTPTSVNLSGVINDYTPANVAGPWEVRGTWSLSVRATGTASFSAALTMEHSDQGVLLSGGGDLNNPAARSAHTHHLTLVNGTVTPIAGGFRVTGPATITANGKFPPPFGASSTLQIDVIGGNSVAFSNIKITLSGDAAAHFGSQPVNGVVQIVK
jgi:hypothetical protein